MPFVPRALRSPESHVFCTLSDLVPQFSCALHAALPNLPRVLRALVFHVRRTLRALEPQDLA